MDNNGCGIIATYNVLLGLNRRKDLADIAYSFDKNSGTIVSGIFGADPTHFSIYFKNNNINYTKYTSYNTLQEGISNMSNDQMILVCAWNGDSITDGAHYVAASYTSGNANPITVYNRYSNRYISYTFKSFDKSIIGGNLITAYIVG